MTRFSIKLATLAVFAITYTTICDRQLAGTGSAEYRSLAAAMDMPPGSGLVY